jgi:hypothetical protein
MLARRTLLNRLLVGCLAALGVVGTTMAADPPASGAGGLQKSFDLQKQLETGLKARRPADFVYIKKIVNKVENGTLPRTLVDKAFLWARGQGSRAPIVHFQFALKELAKKANVTL